MLYAWIGFLKSGAETIPASLQESVTDFLSQPIIKIRSAEEGPPSQGARTGLPPRGF